MPEVPPHAIHEIYTKNRMMELLEELTGLENRMPGQVGEKRASELLAEELRSDGVRNVERNQFKIDGWWRENSKLVLGDSHSKKYEYPHEIVALPGTPSKEIQAELVDVGYGTPRDFENSDIGGKIVLAAASDDIPPESDRRYHRTEKYARAVEEGAAGFIYRIPMAGALPSTGWIDSFSPGSGPIPAVGISKEAGEQLVRYCKQVKPSVLLSIDCRNEQANSYNVEGVIGPDTDKEVLVTAHLDAHDLGDGARDNGAGSVLATEIGRLLASMESELETKVRIVIFGAEEAGHQGARHWIAANDINVIKCVVNLDGVGDTRDLKITTCGFVEVGKAFETMSNELSVPVEITSDFHMFGDQWAFVQQGIPGIFAGSAASDDDRRWGLGRLWSHTHADTLDKIDIRDLRELLYPLLTSVVKLAESSREITPTTSDEIRNRLDSEILDMLDKTGRGYALY